MPSSEIPEVTIKISERFYMAVAYLEDTKQIRGLGTLAKDWGVSRFALSWSRNHPTEKRIKLEYLYYISKQYKISLDWLFFGKGDMIR